MLARLHILMPYTIILPENQEFKIYETKDGDYTVRFLPPQRDPAMITGPQPSELKLSGKPAIQTNVMRIDFHKEEFDRTADGSIDPPEDVIRRAVSDFHARLRFTTRAAHASPVSFPWNQWKLDYTKDDGSELETPKGYVKCRGTIQYHFSFIGISPQVWDNAFALPGGFKIPVWDGLRLDALAALPNVGTAVVLAATSLEVFISVLLDELAFRQNLSDTLWTWIAARGGRILQQPSVEEQFDDLLKEFTGHTLKEDTALWEAFKNLKSARNSFVHEGVAMVGKTDLSKDDAAKLIGRVDAIIAKIREWLPKEMRWPVPEAKVDLEWTHKLIERSDSSERKLA
jgi:hypothetical protein